MPWNVGIIGAGPGVAALHLPVLGRLADLFRVVHIADVLVSGGYTELQRASGYRAILVVPIMRDEVAIGAIAVMQLEPRLFPETQVELLKTFASQAATAIGQYMISTLP